LAGRLISRVRPLPRHEAEDESRKCAHGANTTHVSSLVTGTRNYARISLISLDVLLLRAPQEETSSPSTRWAV
jgi:hypothetical protein